MASDHIYVYQIAIFDFALFSARNGAFPISDASIKTFTIILGQKKHGFFQIYHIHRILEIYAVNSHQPKMFASFDTNRTFYPRGLVSMCMAHSMESDS